MHMQWYNTNIHIPYNLQFVHGMIYIMHEMFSMLISRVTHRLPHTCLCQVWQSSLVMSMTPIYQAFVSSPTPNAICQWVTHPDRVNPDSYHSTLGLSDKHNRVFYLGQQNFSDSTASLLHPCKTFSDSTAGLLHPFGSFTPIRVFYTFGSFTHSGLLHSCRTFRILPRVSYTRCKNAQHTLIISHFII